MLPACGVMVVVTTKYGFLTSVRIGVMAAGTREEAPVNGSETLVAGSVTSLAAKTGTGMRTRRTRAAIRRQERSFIFFTKRNAIYRYDSSLYALYFSWV
jgi:hypothetical protein